MNHPHHRSRLRGALLCAGLAAALLHRAGAAPVTSPGFTATPLVTHNTSDAIISYDWAAATGLYYLTTATYPDNGQSLWKATGGTPLQVYTNSTNFAGNNLVASGDYLYFNDSDLSNHQFIRRYGPLSGNPAVTLTSTASNFGLYGHAGNLFVTAKNGSAPANLFYTGLAADGHLLSDPPLSLGDPTTGLGGGSGGSGPLVFDLAGNLYYAPGYNDPSIYKFAASEVADAIAQNGHPLKVTGHRWLSYGTAYPNKGASSLLVDPDGDLLMTLTNYGDPSLLVEFGVAPDGSYDNTATDVLSATALGDLRLHDGKVYISADNGIFEIVPEPGTLALLTLGMGAVALRRRRRARATMSVLALMTTLAGSAMAGPYSTGLANANANAPDAGIPGFVGPAGDGVVGNGNAVNPLFVGWASSVVAYAPAPGVGTAFSHADLALGPVTGDNASIVSLGDVPAGTSRPNPGTLTLGFANPISNGPGADFAAFENGFISDGSSGVEGEISGELGYVEVSTDGSRFARFSSVSLTPAAVGPYGTFNSTNVYNLVGKHVNALGDSWGTPFDLQTLANDPLVVSGAVDLNRILYIRIVDIPGDGTWLDASGHSIFDAWLTTGSGGLDFEALGVIHQIPEPRHYGLLALGLGGLLAARPRVS
ncbi:MAG TPA: PEP-CTERM sorting domain-containing protein [Chthoniobacteraceae bacterium]|jgi:hypothetical protein|nr:PEP-CTERM sorting domain-containing protein [Chthoniobacteraceae bacterium]